MDQQTYHVLLEGRTVGPYDRKTIVGMRIKHMLTGDNLLVTSGGSRLTVRELIGASPPDQEPGGARAGGSSRAHATYTGMLVDLSGRAHDIPRFKGEVEVRVHTDVLRLAGRFRQALRWKDGRIKLPLKDVVHAHAKGPRTDVWLQREGSARLQHLGLYMFTAEAAEELAGWLAPPAAPPHPAAAAARAAAADQRAMSPARVLAIVISGMAVVIGLLLLTLLRHRLH